MALSCKQHKILPLQMEKNVLRQGEELKNQKTSLRAGKGKRQVVTRAGVSWRWLPCSGNEWIPVEWALNER